MVQEKGASGDFDYLWKEADGSDGVDVVDDVNEHASEPDLDYLLADPQPDEHDGFDAFDEKTWGEDFTPVATKPWHRSAQARTLLIASATALSAIVISVVLLVFRGSPARVEPAPVETTSPVTTAIATTVSEVPPQPPSPPPPPAPEPSAAVEAPPAVVHPTTERPTPSKGPAIDVTRLPMSVAPQPHKAR